MCFLGALIPVHSHLINKIETKAEFILLVEKDCIFRKLIDEKLTEQIDKPFIMLTVNETLHLLNTKLFNAILIIPGQRIPFNFYSAISSKALRSSENTNTRFI